MKNFSHGLLYSVGPEYFSRLHIGDDEQVNSAGTGKFSWQQADRENSKTRFERLKMIARRLGLLK